VPWVLGRQEGAHFFSPEDLFPADFPPWIDANVLFFSPFNDFPAGRPFLLKRGLLMRTVLGRDLEGE